MVQPIPGSRVTPISPDTWRVSAGYQSSQGIVQGNGADWFGPLNPMAPSAPAEVAGRALDFPSGYNLETIVRPYEPITFNQLIGLADNYDVLRLVIETRKDQMEKLTPVFQPKLGLDGRPRCQPDDPRIQQLTDFFEMPDKIHFWGEWLRMLLEQMFVIDAATLFKRRSRNGKLYSLEPIDGATIKRVIDDWGRTPAAPAPAYQQILKGLPAVNYTSNDLLYLPRNTRVHKFYGFSPVEQVIMSVNIALRRELYQLQYYTEGNIPEALCGTPDTWTPVQIRQFQDSFDAMLAGNQAMRRKLRFVPGGVAKTYIPTKEPDLTGKQDEWLARVVCFCFSISPQPFVSMMNRATADTAHDAALEEGLAPVQSWVSRMVNRVIMQDFGWSDIEHSWKDDREVDPQVQMTVLTGYVKEGILKRNEARDQLGQAPEPGGDTLMVDTVTGPVPVDINKDMPTAGEQADQNQTNNEAKLEAIKKQPQQQGGEPSPGQDSQQEVGKSDRPLALAKAARARLTHSTKSVTSATKRYARTLRRALKELARQATRHALESYKAAKDDDQDMDWTILVAPTAAELTAVAQEGVRQALITLDMTDDASITDDAYQDAIDQATARAAELVGMKYDADGVLEQNPNARYRIDESTRDAVRQAVEEAIKEGLPASELADKIQGLGEFSDARAEMIARTEIIRANNQGHMAAFRASGVVEMKSWSTADDANCCDLCTANEEQGAIPLDDEFESGDIAPPGHPNCRCTIVPEIDD